MKIILSGATGFLGNQIRINLIGYEFISIGRKNANINIDLSLQAPILPTSSIIIHAAGKAHLTPKTKKQIQDFYDVNVIGTRNLLKGLEQAPSLPIAFIFVSSVAVYGMIAGTNISEETELVGADPYGASKIEAENLIQHWCKKNNVICTILRLPLLVGPNPPGNLASMIKGIKSGYYFNVAGGKASKSMVLAEDVAKVIPVVANIGGIYNLTDRYHPSFSELSELIAQQSGKSKPLNMPYWFANLIAKAGDLIGPKAPVNSKKLSKITSDLTFDDSKAVAAFGWNPTPVLQGFKIK